MVRSAPLRFSSSADLLRLAVVYALLAGMPRMLMTTRLGLLPGGWVNLECLAIGAAGVFLPPGAVFGLMVLESATDFAYAICSTYQFSLSEIFVSLNSVATLPIAHRLEMAAATALILVSAAGIAWMPRHEGEPLRKAAALLALGVVLLVAAIAGGQSRLRMRDSTDSSRHLVRTPMISLLLREAFLRRVRNGSLHPDSSAADSGSQHLQEAVTAAGTLRPDVVLVLVESWGSPADPELADALTQPYRTAEIGSRYVLSKGTATFEGGTVAAGARELCHSRMSFGILRIQPEQSAHCLPAWFHNRGYEDISVHGYSGRMFQRDRWHPAIGFDRSWFGEELTELPVCPGAFPGVCDGALAEWIGRSLLLGERNRPRFVYWITLNSHLPVPSKVDLPDGGACSHTAGSSPLCSWARLVLQVHASVQRLALTVQQPTVFLVVGDHAPPFGDAALRRQFSGEKVPWILLEPKRSGQSYKALSTTIVSSSK